MSSKPSCRDYGVPDALIVPPGELIKGWSDKHSFYANRSIMYNLHVIYEMQSDIMRRLDSHENHAIGITADILEQISPSVKGSSIREQVAAAKGDDPTVHPTVPPTIPVEQYLESVTTAAENTTPTSATSSDGEFPLLVYGSEQYLKAIADDTAAAAAAAAVATRTAATSSSRPVVNLPPLIHRFVKSDETTTPILLSASAAVPATSPVAIKDTHVPASALAAIEAQTASDAITHFAHKPLVQRATTIMATSDSLSDLAGLVIESSQPSARTLSSSSPSPSPPPPGAEEGDEDPQLVSLPKPDNSRWARLRKLAGNDNYDGDHSSISSSTNTAKQEHLDLAYWAAGSASDRPTRNHVTLLEPVSSPPQNRSNGHGSIDSSNSSGYDLYQRAKAQQQASVREITYASPAVHAKQQEILFPIPALNGPTHKSSTITSTVAGTVPIRHSTLPGFQEWRSQADRTPIRTNGKGKLKVEDYSFW